ncbi:leucine-rich repeat protein [Sodaliphilus pleomorphus]|nr:leucine-rich repeat protein [Sodaliphilus pleomorphus]
MRDEKNDKLYAVKCFLKDQPNRAENYRMIAEELEYVSSSFLTKFQYLDNELFVDAAHADGEEFPVLLMDWVEGTNLDLYIRQHLHDSYQLHLLAYQFSRLALWLMPQPFAHGDLKPDNIMVREDGTLVLIDYDGMFVPAMKGQKAREMGSPDFRHPARTEETFNEHIDDFSLASILLSLRVIAEEPALLEKYGAADRLLFSEKDYRAIHDCQLLKDIFPSECPEVNTLVGLFIIALTQSDLSNVSFRLLSLERPKEPEIEIISTEVTEEDKKDAWTDEFGVKYSKDGKKLLKSTNSYLTNYTIRQGTRSICNGAFSWCTSLQSVTIPDSVTSIGNSAFSSCDSLQSVNIPNSVTSIGDRAFAVCDSLQSVTIPDSVTSIGDWAFAGCSSLQSVTIPDSVTSISDRAFMGCSSLQSVTIPDSVTSIGNSAFSYCKSLQSVTIPDSVTSIGNSAFENCSSLQSVIISDSVTSIGNLAFSYCDSL